MIYHGDCLDVMKTFSDNHFTSIITDPPYGLGFMNKDWDKGIPGVAYWQEALRVCKPGAMMLCFGGTRTYHRLTCAIEDAGWEIRDCLMWLYGSGFPKSHNNFGFEGYGTALKPSYEPIIMAMKPLDGTFAQNAEKWGVAGINIDACRIEGKRWPANTLFDEQAAEMLDIQTGILKSGKLTPSDTKKSNAVYGTYNKACINEFESNSGGASRFFYCAKASSAERNKGCEELPSKANMRVNAPRQDEESKHSNVMKNFHPTVKPLKLMEYLIKLIAPPKDALILDPFAGSGTTCVAAKSVGIDCIGIELNEEYVEIANARIKGLQTQLPLFS